MARTLEGKVIAVTGAGRGIGREIAFPQLGWYAESERRGRRHHRYARRFAAVLVYPELV